MELITITYDIREHFEIKGSHITYDNKDYMAIIKQLSLDTVIICLPFIDLSYGSNFILQFNSVCGIVKINIVCDVFYENEGMLICECSILDGIEHNFFVLFKQFIEEILAQKKRKEQRILCSQKNLELLKLNNVISFDFRYRKLKGVIKDISYSGLRVLANPILLEENGELFSFRLSFTDPVENFVFINCPIRRKELFVFQGTEFASVVFKINGSIKFKERISNYLNQIENISINKKSL